MHILTDRPAAKFDGDHIALSLPSGSTPLEIRLTVHDAKLLACVLAVVAEEGFAEQKRRNATATAEIIAFPRDVASLARREREVKRLMRVVRVERLELQREGRARS